MQAKIIFLGTGGDSIVVGKQLRASGGIILQIDDNQFHIDPGPGALVRARQERKPSLTSEKPFKDTLPSWKKIIFLFPRNDLKRLWWQYEQIAQDFGP